MTHNCDDHKRPCIDAHEVAENAVRKTFAILGVNVDDPDSVESFREDLRFGRRLRKAANHGTLAMVGAVSVALVGAVWLGILDKIGGVK